MTGRHEVDAFLSRWAQRHEARDLEGSADLYLRDPAPLVVFSDGARVEDWLDVRVRIARDIARIMIERIDVHDVKTSDLGDDVCVVSFAYDLTLRDMWGTRTVAPRQASMTLVETKDGLRIASAHFSR